MVHLLDPEPEQGTSPFCPKCDSHRTDIIDRADDGREMTVHCEDCSERSTVVIDRRLFDRRAGNADHMTDELDAIRTLGEVLARLPDTAARVRVLRWAAERFEIDTAVAAAAPAAQVPADALNVFDQTLSMEGLHDLFPASVARNNARDLAIDDTLAMDADPLPVQNTRQTIEHDTLAMPLEAMDPEPKVVQQPAAASAVPQRADSLIHSFVLDLQRLAEDCQTVFAEPISTTPQ